MRSAVPIARNLVLAGLLAGGAAGCTSLNSFAIGDLPVPADSPVAIAARQAAANPGPFPTFAAVPKADPNDTPPQKGPDANTAALAQGDSLRAVTSGFPAINPAAIAAYSAQGQAVAKTVPAPAAGSPDDVAAFAAAARARATPPPPPS